MRNYLTIAFLSALGFMILASFNKVYAWPLVFPLLGGLLAMSARNSSSDNRSYGSVVRSGTYASLLVLVIGILAFSFLLKGSNMKGDDVFGDGQSPNKIVIALLISVIFFVTYLIGTGIGSILFRKKH